MSVADKAVAEAAYVADEAMSEAATMMMTAIAIKTIVIIILRAKRRAAAVAAEEEQVRRQAADALAEAVAAVADEVWHEFLEWVEGVAKDAGVASGGTPISVETCEEDIVTI